MIPNKKGEGTFWLLVKIIIAVFAVLIIVSTFFPQISIFGDLFKAQQSGLNTDSDGDGFFDFQDDCPCTYGELEENGCPYGITDDDRLEEKAKYNTDTKCGTIESDPETERQLDEIDPEQRFKHYRSVEFKGNYDGENEDAQINQACVGMVGRECSTESCSVDSFSYQTFNDRCAVMVVEVDGLLNPNDCGQFHIMEEEIISKTVYGHTPNPESAYFSVDGDTDPMKLLRWNWISKEEYGSLICNKGFWFGCKQGQEGKELVINNKIYTCNNEEWKLK